MTHRLARAAPAVLFGLLIALPAAPLPLRAAVPDDAWSDAFRFPGPPADVLALGEHDGELVAGDHLWTGSEWRRLGAGLDGPVHALASHEGDLYAAGDFRGSGPVALSRVARWDGAAWRPVGEGLPEVCRALTVYAGRLHAGARMWNGAAWSDVLQTDGAVLGLAVHEGVLVAVGEFAEAGGAPAGGVVGWDGADLVPMPALPAGCPEALAVHDGRLVAAGRFTIPEHGEGAAVLALDGASWEVLRFDAGVDTVRQPFYTALASRDGALFVGGAEYSGWEGGYIGVRLKLLRGEGEAWSDVGWSGRGEILALLSRPAGLVAGGSFLGVSDAGGRHFAPRAARLAPGGLEPLLQTGEGLEDEVTHLVSWDEVLVAGGSFAAAGANFAAAYAGWTAAGWQAMDAWPILGPPDSPRAGSLAIHGGALFTTALCGTVDGCGEYYGRWYPGYAGGVFVGSFPSAFLM